MWLPGSLPLGNGSDAFLGHPRAPGEYPGDGARGRFGLGTGARDRPDGARTVSVRAYMCARDPCARVYVGARYVGLRYTRARRACARRVRAIRARASSRNSSYCHARSRDERA